jgi:putative ABC transport system permease protein
VNLATAQAQRQAKEVGMRRVIGAGARQVATQYLFEAALLTFAALAIAIVVDLAWARIAGSSGGGAGFALGVILGQPVFWIVLVALPCVVSIVAGAYPAFACAHMRPIVAVRSGQSRRGTGAFATLLVGAQFAAASFLLISILIMTQQNREVQRAARATIKDPTVVLTNDVRRAGVDFEQLRAELLRQPHIRAVSGSMFAPWTNSGFTPVSRTADAAAQRLSANTSYINYEFFDALQFKLLAGRVFERTRPEQGLVIDRALAAQLGWSNPADAVGKTVVTWQTPPNGTVVPQPTPVIGVVESKPLVITGLGSTTNAYILAPGAATRAIIRVSRENLPTALGEIDAVWTRLAPNVAVQRHLIDDLMVSAFGPFEMITKGFSAVASLALVGAVLGLIGMSLHAIGRRTHEIGVRKTLGASVVGILRLLLKDFSKPVVIANIVAWPLAFLAMQLYLSIFMQRVGLSWTPFILSLAIALAVAWLAVIVQASRAARLNPATVLRYE